MIETYEDRKGRESELNTHMVLKKLVRVGLVQSFNDTDKYSTLDRNGVDFQIYLTNEDDRRKKLYMALQCKSSFGAQMNHNNIRGQQVYAVNGQSPNLEWQIRTAIQYFKTNIPPKRFQLAIKKAYLDNQKAENQTMVDKLEKQKEVEEKAKQEAQMLTTEVKPAKGVYRHGERFKVELYDPRFKHSKYFGLFNTIEEANKEAIRLKEELSQYKTKGKRKTLKACTPAIKGNLTDKVKALIEENKQLKEQLTEYEELKRLLA